MEPTPGKCRCYEIAEEMDKLGVEGCRNQYNRLVTEVKASASDWIDENRPLLKLAGWPIKKVLSSLVRRCINEAAGELTPTDQWIDKFLDQFFPYQEEKNGPPEKPIAEPADDPFRFFDEPKKIRISKIR